MRRWQRKLDKMDEEKRWESAEERERVLDMLADDHLGERPPTWDEALKAFYGGQSQMKLSSSQVPLLEWLKKNGGVK
jgi:hypothetical protein